MAKWKLIYIVVLFVLSTLSALAQHVNFVTEDLPPFQILKKDGNHTGAAIEIVSAVIQEAGFNANIKIYPWARAYNLGQNQKNTFIFSLIRSEEREQLFQWIGELYTIKPFLAKLANSDKVNIETLNDAKQFKTGVIRHAIAEDYLVKKGFVINQHIYNSSSYNLLWQNLFNGRTDLVFTNNALWQPQLAQASLDENAVTLAFPIPDFSTVMYLAASKNTAPDLIQKAKIALDNVKSSGQYDKIMKKWKLL